MQNTFKEKEMVFTFFIHQNCVKVNNTCIEKKKIQAIDWVRNSKIKNKTGNEYAAIY